MTTNALRELLEKLEKDCQKVTQGSVLKVDNIQEFYEHLLTDKSLTAFSNVMKCVTGYTDGKVTSELVAFTIYQRVSVNQRGETVGLAAEKLCALANALSSEDKIVGLLTPLSRMKLEITDLSLPQAIFLFVHIRPDDVEEVKRISTQRGIKAEVQADQTAPVSLDEIFNKETK